MGKSVCKLVAVSLVVLILVGCSNGAISNKHILITKYKGLKVEETTSIDKEEVIIELENNVWQALIDNCTVKEYPQEELESLIRELETQYGYAAYYQNMEAAELIENIHGMSPEELAKEQLMKQYAVELIAEKEELFITDEAYLEELEKRAWENGFENATEYENMFGREVLSRQFLEEIVLKFLIDNLA